MEMISKVSRGSRMDQVYLPKNRSGFSIGDYVIIRSFEPLKEIEKLYFYNIDYIEPIKIQIIEHIFEIINKYSDKYDNILVNGSFLEKGFHFNDVDILLIKEG